MSRFRRLSRSETEQLYRHAQMDGPVDSLTCPNPNCPSQGQPFGNDELREKRISYGRYLYRCPFCGQEDSSRKFTRPMLVQTGDFNKGVNLTNNPVAQRVQVSPGPGITTIP